MDVVSQILKIIQLQGAVFFNVECCAPWTVREPESCVLAPHLVSEASHLIIYHLVTEGRAWAQLDSGSRVHLEAGDVVVFPRGDAHVMGNGTPSPPIDMAGDIEKILSKGLGANRIGGEGEVTRIVCGYMACDPQLCQVLLSGLPSLLKINIRDDASGAWLENTIRYSVDHLGASGPGAEVALAKLSEVLFVEILRRYVAGMPPEETGWLAGARDPDVGKALGLLHQEPARKWTISELASEVGVSRAILAERFREFLDDSPIGYLTRWRLRLGARLLGTTSESVAQVAARAGYDSEAAFNRAFKREFGVPPAQFRRESRAGARTPGTLPTNAGQGRGEVVGERVLAAT